MRRGWSWIVAIALVCAIATFIGGRRVEASELAVYGRCAVVDPHAHKVIETKQGSGDTIVRVIGYVKIDGKTVFEARVWRFARRLVTHGTGTGLRYGCRE